MSEIRPVGHSRVGFSAWYRWGVCTASVERSAGLADEPREAAIRGTVMHEVAAALLQGLRPPPEHRLTDEERIVVSTYVAHVNDRHLELGGDLLVEQQVHLQALDPELWGTADAIIVTPEGHFEVIDLKSGDYIEVPVRLPDGSLNGQLGGYLLGALMKVPGEVRSLRATIVQPRRGGVKSTEVDVMELEDFSGQLIAALWKVRHAPEVSPGAHCVFCLAKPDCEEYQKRNLRVAQDLFDDETDV